MELFYFPKECIRIFRWFWNFKTSYTSSGFCNAGMTPYKNEKPIPLVMISIRDETIRKNAAFSVPLKQSSSTFLSFKKRFSSSSYFPYFPITGINVDILKKRKIHLYPADKNPTLLGYKWAQVDIFG